MYFKRLEQIAIACSFVLKKKNTTSHIKNYFDPVISWEELINIYVIYYTYESILFFTLIFINTFHQESRAKYAFILN